MIPCKLAKAISCVQSAYHSNKLLQQAEANKPSLNDSGSILKMKHFLLVFLISSSAFIHAFQNSLLIDCKRCHRFKGGNPSSSFATSGTSTTAHRILNKVQWETFTKGGTVSTQRVNMRLLDHTQPIQPEDVDISKGSTIWEVIASTLSRSISGNSKNQAETERIKVSLITLLRVGVPSIVSGFLAFFLFPFLAIFLASLMNDAGVFAVLSQDSSQFVQNFLTVSGLLFSILIGQTYAFLYQQQEAVFYSLFNEVTEAKSLLEQVALVCQGRAMYGKVLESISKYVRDDLKQLQADPAILISSRPVDDPLESIMYMTSVGVPSSVYETVKSLRQARAARLGALQRKLPRIHMLLLWILAGIEVISFPLLGAGTQTIGGYNILTVEGSLFGIMVFGIVVTMRVSNSK